MRLLTPYWPMQRTTDLFTEMERFFDDIAREPVSAAKSFSPFCDVQENEDRYVISADLPGVKKDDIKIEMNDNVLTLSGERKRGEQAFTFTRSFTVPRTVDFDKVAAHHADGVLTIELPKAALAKSRKIEIRTPAH